jgi:hypothetical protein
MSRFAVVQTVSTPRALTFKVNAAGNRSGFNDFYGIVNPHQVGADLCVCPPEGEHAGSPYVHRKWRMIFYVRNDEIKKIQIIDAG